MKSMSPVAEYKQLIAQVPPKVIHSGEEHRFYLETIEDLNGRWTDLTQAERDLYDTLCVLVGDFEKKSYKLRAATPLEVIKELMQANGLKQKDLVGIFETASVVSEVLKGKRALTTDHIRRLGKRFNVSPAVFL
jgi:HTH-type transcriptional regulator / antitoxin HigA